MQPLSALLVLALADFAFGYALAPQLTWPEEYHFHGEEINLETSIVKPFEIWYSNKHNRSRIDFFGGIISRYYYGANEHGPGKIYMIHPQVANDDSKNEIKCDIMGHWSDQEDFLPDLYDFEFSGTEEHDGKEAQVWKRTTKVYGVISYEETLLVEDIDGDVGIPLHHYQKMWNLKDGSLTGYTVVNYYNYENKIKLNDLDAAKHDCSRWRSFPEDFYEAVNYLHPSIDGDVDLAFNRFKRHHARDYEDHEHHSRKEIFRQNWHMIVDHNRKNLGYTLGLNQFADKTMDELSYLSGVKSSGPIHGTHPFPHSEVELASMVEELPENFDLRSEGVISPVRNQAECGSCWAFATAATVEGTLARSNGGRLVDLSEQSLVDCAWAYKSHGCQGTEEINAPYEYLMKHGLPTVQEYGPYLAEDGVCKINNMTEMYKIKGFVAVTKNSPNALKAALYKYGPVTIGAMVTEKMAFYRSGVFYDLECPPNPRAINHAVTMVGYGVRDGDLYWIVKNSYGESWGESGYILMSAKNNNCNVMTCPFYPLFPQNPTVGNHVMTLVGYGVRDGDLYWIVKNSYGESWGEAGYILISAKNNNCNVLSYPLYPLL